MRKLAVTLVAAALAVGATHPAGAQTRRGASDGPGYAAEQGGSQPRYPSRGADIYSRPPGSGGTIGPNSPNASGNLGGPSAGGGGAT